MSLANFLIIGAPRCGTDFISSSLKQHPQICFSKKREVHFFDRNFEKGLEWYQTFFSDCTTQLIGEKTANYLINTDAAKRIYKYSPDIKLIISLRNPIYRAFSHYSNWLSKGNLISSTTTFKQCIAQFPDIIEIGFYSKYIENIYNYFPKENIHILFFENIINNPQKELNQILSFLKIQTNFQFLIQKKNQSIPPLKYNFIPKKIGVILYRHLFSKINPAFLKYLYKENPKINKSDYNYLYNIYKSENQKLYDLLNIKPIWND